MLKWQNKKIIKVVTEVRRCGKSTLLQVFQKTLLSQGISQDCIQSINLDAIENEHLYDYHKLYKQITDNLIPEKMNYIFLDEIQMVPDFEKTINSLFLKDNIDIYLTGSNAYMLSGEIATLLSGRYIEIKMLPLSFAEYCELCSEISGNKVEADRKTASATVENCYTALTESYLFYKATRYDIKGKEFLKSLEKYYAVDTGLHYFMLGNKTGNEGFILENIVYLELLRRGYEVYVGKFGNMEVNFVAIKNGLPEYYQVSLSVTNEETLNRELKPLKAIKDSYPKFLITLDECNEVSHNGIRQLYALDWMCGRIN